MPKEDSRRVITFANQEDFITFRSLCKLTPHVLMSNLLLFEVNIPKSNVFFIYYFRHHTYKKTDHKNVELTEVGPRFEMRCKYGWTKGDFWILIIIQVFGIPCKYIARPTGPTNAAIDLQVWFRRSSAVSPLADALSE